MIYEGSLMLVYFQILQVLETYFPRILFKNNVFYKELKD